MKSKVETQEMRWITAVQTGGFCFLMGFRSWTSGVSIQEKDPVSKCFQVLMDSNSSQGWLVFLSPSAINSFQNQWKYFLWSYQAAALLLKCISRENLTQSNWAQLGAKGGPAQAAHLENIPTGKVCWSREGAPQGVRGNPQLASS